MNRILGFGLIFIIFFIMDVRARDMVTDRPDFTESALAVPSRMIQIEGGGVYAGSESSDELSLLLALARIGVGYNLEIRIGFAGWTSIITADKTTAHFNDLILEAKYTLTGEKSKLPLAVLLISRLPTGADAVSAGYTEVGLKLAAAYDLSDRLSLGANLGVISVQADSRREVLSLASVSLGIGFTDRLGAFVETFTEIPQEETWRSVVDTGLTYLLTPEMQLDIYLGTGLNTSALNLLVGGGFSFRFGY